MSVRFFSESSSGRGRRAGAKATPHRRQTGEQLLLAVLLERGWLYIPGEYYYLARLGLNRAQVDEAVDALAARGVVEVGVSCRGGFQVLLLGPEGDEEE
jgi:hypothetical protein